MNTLDCNISNIKIDPAYRLAAKRSVDHTTIVRVGHIKIGASALTIMAGPCAVESKKQLLETAKSVERFGGQILRGGAFKPRTSPYSFRGLEEEGLKYLKLAGLEAGMPIVTEVMDTRQVGLVGAYADMLQIGSRNMSNFPLLMEAGLSQKPILLKRGMNATIEEFVMAAEYILSRGNDQVVLCERGIRTFETAYRNTLDLNAVPMLKSMTHLPVIVDPSHGTGHRWMVAPMAKAAIAAGADGLLTEVHYRPEEALCDGAQSLSPEEFQKLMEELKVLAPSVGRKVGKDEGILKN
ncbi:MAG: 3-deoxy-7-phosphoheptulonate synthase [Cytophagales bacterium]|nr:3-deoxy-7-phosphoheptulonate synthase [Cytophagales bacterium]